jgi:3-hydroxyisobutyrate dehydrogenase-like beta-hydroxyacid dehydrogenase
MNSTQTNRPRVAFLGFGEAGQTIASGLRDAGVSSIAAWDILFLDAAGAKLKDMAGKVGVRIADSAADAVADADLVFCAVTASSSLKAAASARPHMTAGQFFLDINSVSPARKREVGDSMVGAVRYVDVAVMAPVQPARHRTPMLLAGREAEALLPLMLGMDMRVSVAGPEIGMAAAIKMIRSVMVKGLEALTFECFVAASRAGVTDQVMGSLQASFPGLDWPAIIQYNLERMQQHGIRRAAEMREVTATVRELGVEPHMASATVEQQQRMGELKLPYKLDGAAREEVANTLKAVGEALAATGAQAQAAE